MGINRISTYLPFTLGALLRRAAGATPMHSADAVTPRRSVRARLVSSSVSPRASFPLLSLFSFAAANRIEIFRGGIISRLAFLAGATHRRILDIVASPRQTSRFLSGTRRVLNEPVIVCVFGYVTFSRQLKHRMVRYATTVRRISVCELISRRSVSYN